MGILYDLFGRTKKRCTMCGCHMYDDSDSDICEVCVDELLESDPGEPEADEIDPKFSLAVYNVEPKGKSLYPSILISYDMNTEAKEKFKEIINSRVAEKRGLK